MTAIAAVLLVPEDGDPHELLREGPCGARPPMAYQCSGCGWNPDPSDACDEDGLCVMCGADLVTPGPPVALVLAWDGKPDRKECNEFARKAGYKPREEWEIGFVLDVVLWAAMDGWGTPLALDAGGQVVEQPYE